MSAPSKPAWTLAATLTCQHGGTVTVFGVDRLRVDGKAVVTLAKLADGTVSTCGGPTPPGPCTKVVLEPGQTRLLRVDGVPVAFEGVLATGTPGAGTIGATGVQTRLKTE